MSGDLWLSLALALTGIADVWCEHLTGEGIIGHVADWIARLK